MVRKYALIEKCALIKERFMVPPISTAHLLGLPVHDRYCHKSTVAIIRIIWGHSKWKRTGNRGFEKYCKSREQTPEQATIVEVATTQVNVWLLAMAPSPLEQYVDNNQQ